MINGRIKSLTVAPPPHAAVQCHGARKHDLINLFACSLAVPVSYVHQMPPTPFGLTVNVCSLTASNVVFWQPTECCRDPVSRCARAIVSWSTLRTTWRAWKWPSIGMVSTSEIPSTMMACHMWRSALFSREQHSGKMNIGWYAGQKCVQAKKNNLHVPFSTIFVVENGQTYVTRVPKIQSLIY